MPTLSSSSAASDVYKRQGQDLSGVEQAVDHVRSFGFRPHLAHYTPIPGSPLFSEAVLASPYPVAEEPLFQNNSIWPCVPGGFNWDEAARWKDILHGKQGPPPRRDWSPRRYLPSWNFSQSDRKASSPLSVSG
eukprot:TRINITY_DN41935_c0_g1_i1.p4 TRINITY_DN41935_c0_g1~~TRINITY_DN41935_c0_g1_i1.p4  ORF type:complete len:133 (-),score=44.31 TRINITY_DN41935_c0_g1_i1:52-450(-)